MLTMIPDFYKLDTRFSIPTVLTLKEVSQPAAGLKAPRKEGRGPVLP